MQIWRIMELLQELQLRFLNNMHRHKGIEWSAVEARLQANPKALVSLQAMEDSGGEPDVVAYDAQTNQYLFFDCSAETPNRRNVCYDEAARIKRKKFPPEQSAEAQSVAMGVQILNQSQYEYLQTFGDFDCKTSSWIATPEAIRGLGGAYFMEKRYKAVFLYHNGADSYYGVRGWRGFVAV